MKGAHEDVQLRQGGTISRSEARRREAAGHICDLRRDESATNCTCNARSCASVRHPATRMRVDGAGSAMFKQQRERRGICPSVSERCRLGAQEAQVARRWRELGLCGGGKNRGMRFERCAYDLVIQDKVIAFEATESLVTAGRR
jgi:hypothetical protein